MTHPLDERMREIGRRQRQMLLWRGGAVTVAVALSVGMVVAAIDCSLRVQDAGIRWMLSTAWVAALAMTGWRCVLPHWRWRPAPVEVARYVERAFPELSDQLSSAVSFLAQPEHDPTAGSLVLRRSLIDRTTYSVEELDLESATSRDETRRAVHMALAVLGLGLLWAFVQPAVVRQATWRLLLPFTNSPWPRRHELQFQRMPTHVAAGEDVEFVLSDMRGELPAEVVIQLQNFDGQEQAPIESRAMLRSGDVTTYRIANVTQSLRYRATGGDDQAMPWSELQVVQPTRVREARLELTPPAYSRQQATRQPMGRLRVLAGTQIRIRGTASGKLRAVQLHVRQENGSLETISGLVSEDAKGSFQIPPPGANWTASASGVYWISTEDAHGVVLASDDRWELQVSVDQAPTIVLQEPEDNLLVTPRAQVPLTLKINDDLGLDLVELAFTRTDQTQQEEQKVSLWNRTPMEPLAEDGPQTRGVSAESSATTALSLEYTWRIDELQPQIGSVLSYQVRAVDGMPQAGQTLLQRLLVIDDDEYQDRFLRRLAVVLSRLRDLLQQQIRARDQTAALQIDLRQTALQKSQLDRAQGLDLSQRRILDATDGEPDSVSDMLQRLHRSLGFNGLSDSEMNARLVHIAKLVKELHDPLLVLADRETADVASRLRFEFEEAMAGGSTPAAITEATQLALSDLLATQSRAVEAFERLVQDLARWDNYQQFQREIGQVRLQQAELRRATQEIGSRTLTKQANGLSAADQATLENVARQQSELARRVDRLLDGMRQNADGLASKDPNAAAAIAAALRAAQQAAISGVMRQAGQMIERNRIGMAFETQANIDVALAEIQAHLIPRKLADSSEVQRRITSQQQMQQQQVLAALREQLIERLRQASREQGEIIVATEALAEVGRSGRVLADAAQVEASELAERQRLLAGRALEIADDGEELPVFRLGSLMVMDSMTAAADLLARADVGDVTLHYEQDSYAWLVRVANSLAEDATNDERSAAADARTAESRDDPDAEQDVQQQLLELRLLREIQQDILAKTDRFDRMRRQQGSWTVEQRQQWEILAIQQGRLADTFAQLFGQQQPSPAGTQADGRAAAGDEEGSVGDSRSDSSSRVHSTTAKDSSKSLLESLEDELERTRGAERP